MKVNGTDIRKYDAKQLAADVQPPSISVNYEWITGANVPTEFDTEVKMGHLKLSVYFKGKTETVSFGLHLNSWHISQRLVIWNWMDSKANTEAL